jgi:drug/metabolite transporter (DMT)-like permease
LALGAALIFGAGDFLGGLASRRAPTLTVVIWSQAAGFALLLLALPLLPAAPTSADIAWGAAAGLFGAAAVGLLYRGLAIGAMGVVSPITAVLAALLPVAYGALQRALPSPAAVAGIAISLVAVVAISSAPTHGGESVRRGIPEAIAAGALFGAFFIVLAQTHANAGLYPLVGARLASAVMFTAAATVLRVQLRPPRIALAAIVGGGVCDMLANILYVLAVHTGLIAVVAVLTSLYPASTVALAAVVLHERLRAIQWVGVALALLGVGLISAGK